MQNRGLVKNILIVLIAFGVSATVYAANGAPYVGLRIGANSGGSWNLTNPMGKTSYFGISGESAGILGGYSQNFGEKFSLGAEGFLEDSVVRTANKSTDAVGTTVKMRMTYSYGASVIPGYQIATDTVLFVRAGLVRTHFALTQAVPASSSSSTAANTVTGGQAGLGLALSLSKILALRGEYIYSGYQSFTAYGNKVSPHNNQLFASFTYKFL
jgi:opacity protein-like surface antigen